MAITFNHSAAPGLAFQVSALTTTLTADAGDFVIVIAALENVGGSVVDTVSYGGLTFTRRWARTATASTTDETIELWYATTPSAITAGAVDVTTVAEFDNGTLFAYTLSGWNITWDSNSSLPAMASNFGTGTYTGPWTVDTAATTSTNPFVIAILGDAYANTDGYDDGVPSWLTYAWAMTDQNAVEDNGNYWQDTAFGYGSPGAALESGTAVGFSASASSNGYGTLYANTVIVDALHESNLVDIEGAYNGPTGNLTITAPVGMADADCLIAIIGWACAVGHSPTIAGVGASWTVAGQISSPGSGSFYGGQTVLQRTATGSEPSTYVFTDSSSSTNFLSGIVSDFGGSSIDGSPQFGSPAASTTLTAPSATPSAPNDFQLVSVYSYGEGQNPDTPSGFTVLGSYGPANTSSDGQIAVFAQSLSSGSPTGTTTVTLPNTPASGSACTILLTPTPFVPSSYDSVVLADTPFGYWPLEESSGSTAFDQSGNGNNATLAGGYSQGIPGIGDGETATIFDGSTGLASCTLSSGVLPTSAMSIEAWVYTTETSAHGGAFKVGTPSDGLGVGFGDTSFDNDGDDSLGLLEGISWVTASWVLQPNMWHHMVLTSNNTYPNSATTLLYVDGLQVATAGVGMVLPTRGAADLFLGSGTGTSRFWPGAVAKCAAYNYVLTSTQIKDHYLARYTSADLSYDDVVLGCNPLGYWPLDETTGTTAVDQSGNGNNGTYAGGYTLSQAGIGDGETAVAFDGSTGNVSFSLGSAPSTAGTVEVWAYGTTSDIYGSALKLGSGSNGLAVGGGDGFFDVAGNNAIALIESVAWVASTSSMSASTWHHLVATYFSGIVLVYLDGAQVTSGSGTWDTPSAEGSIGSNADASRFWNSSLAKAAVYGYCLTPDQILAHYNAKDYVVLDLTYDEVVLSDDPLSYWPLDETSGTTAIDHSGNGNDLTYSGGYTLNESGIGDGEPSVLFDGSTAEVSGLVSVLNGSTLFSVEAWTYITGDQGAALLEVGSSGITFGMGSGTFGSSGVDWIGLVNGEGYQATSLIVGLSQFHHVVMTIDDAAYNIYVDGALALSGTASGSSAVTEDAGANVWIGTTPYFNPWAGKIAKVAIYGYVLQPHQVLAHYEAQFDSVVSYLATGSFTFDGAGTPPVVIPTASGSFAFQGSGSPPVFIHTGTGSFGFAGSGAPPSSPRATGSLEFQGSGLTPLVISPGTGSFTFEGRGGFEPTGSGAFVFHGSGRWGAIVSVPTIGFIPAA